MEFKGVRAGCGEVSGPSPLSVLILHKQTSCQGKVKCGFHVKERENKEREKCGRNKNYYRVLGFCGWSKGSWVEDEDRAVQKMLFFSLSFTSLQIHVSSGLLGLDL